MLNESMVKFFRNAGDQMLTFGDVRLLPGYSETPPSKISFASRFSRNVGLLVPFVSAAMDTVTESDAAIAMAKLGGIGVIHRRLSPKQQASEVGRTKHALHGFIDRPITVLDTQSVQSVLDLCGKKRYKFDSFPVLDRNGKLVGIVTGRDFEVCIDHSLPVGKIMTPFSKLKVASAGTTRECAYELMRQYKVKFIPLVDKNRHPKGMYSRKDLVRIFEGRARHNVDRQGRLRVAAAIGDTLAERQRAKLLVEKGCDVIVIDMAHAFTKRVFGQLRWLKSNLDVDVVVGNIATGEAAKAFAHTGTDGVKVGIGPGSICTTRIISGVGVTQLTAIYECARALREDGLDIPVCADGGIRYSGDIPVALGAGAHSVMMGNVFAGTDESPGTITLNERGRQVKDYRGMGAVGVMQSRTLSASDRYRRTGIPDDEVVSEGVPAKVPYKGPLRKVVGQLVGGMRSGFHMVGAANVEELQAKARFMRLTAAGIEESHPHGIQITEMPPNYTGR